MKKLFVGLSLIISIQAIAYGKSIDALNIKDSEFMPVFVGGWGSCDSLRPLKEKKRFGLKTPHKMFLYEQAVRYVQTVNKNTDKGIKKFVLVCATKGSQSGTFALGSLRALTYSVQGQEITKSNYKPSLVNLDSHQDNSYRTVIRKLPFLDKRRHLTTYLLDNAKGLPMVVFGHSYGGWIAKRIIEILALPEVYENSPIKRDKKLYRDTITGLEKYQEFPVHTFFSLEGISAVRCRIHRSINAGIQSSMGNATDPGCYSQFDSFQNELSLAQTDKVVSPPLEFTALMLTNWHNIMLLDSKLPTRAGESTVDAINNVFLDIQPYGDAKDYEKSQAHPFKNAHHMLGFHAQTWQKICELTFPENNDVCNPIKEVTNKGRSINKGN